MGKKVNLLHVGDLHIQQSDLFEKDIVLEAFLKDVEILSKTGLKPDVIIFTGDLVQAGDEVKDFELALDHFLFPLCEQTDCSFERIFFTQGNHDLQRAIVENNKTLAIGLDSNILSKELLDKEVIREECKTYVQNKFENFTLYTEDFGNTYLIERNCFYAVHFIKELNLSIISVNTSWLSNGGKFRDDKGKLAISDVLLQKAIKAAPQTSRKILIGHHPIDWLAEFNQSYVSRIIQREVDFYLHGHLHEGDPKQLSGVQGKVLFNQCGSLYSDSEYFNGYSIISLDVENEHVEVNMRTYFAKRQAFDKAIDICEDGKFYPTEEAKTYWRSHPESIDALSLEKWLKSDYLQSLHKEFDVGFYKESLSEVYVEPTVCDRPEQLRYKETEQEDKKDQPCISINDLGQSKENFILYAGKEYGKTSLLQKIAIACIEDRGGVTLTIPFLINYKELKIGRRQIEKSLKQSLHPTDLPEGVSLDKVLKLHMATIIIDDIDNNDNNKIKMLVKFMEEHRGNRFILCIDGALYENLGAVWMPETNLDFRTIFLHSFSTAKLRQLVEKWTKTNDKKRNQKVLDRVVDNILQINVPRTPVIGSILLAILEQNSDFSPINKASMIERFIETLLGKHQPDEARRNTFDYRNKEHYLAFLAGKMVALDKYSFSQSELVSITSDYLNEYAFKENPSHIINIFIKSRIFSEVNNTIRFKYRSICEYFIAKQMSESPDFRSKILCGDDYLMFQNEIECLSGIKKSDLSLLEAVRNKFFELDDQIELIAKLETFNTLNIRAEGSQELLATVDQDLQSGALTDEEKDAMLETNFPQDIGQRQDMHRPIYNDFGHKWISALILYSRVLKNTEMLSARDKRMHLFTVISKWASLALYSIYAVPTLVEKKQIKINGQVYKIVLPANKTDEDLFHHLCLAAGIGAISITKSVVGTEKLSSIFDEKLAEEDALVIELFQNLVLLHIDSSTAIKKLKSSVNKMRHSSYLLELILIEINHVIKTKPLNRDEEEELIGIIDIVGKSLRKGLSKNEEQYARAKYREQVKKRLLVEKKKAQS